MRILLATHFFPPGHLGGTEVLTLGLARALQKANQTVNVICAEDWDTAPSHSIRHTDDLVENISVRRLHFNWSKSPDVFTYLYNNPEVERNMLNFLSQIQPDIVHITSCYSLSASIIWAASKLGIPIVLTATDFWFLCARNTLLRNDGSLCSVPEDPWECARCMLAEAKFYRWPRKVLPEATVTNLLKVTSRFPFLTRQRGLRGMLGDWGDRSSFLLESLKKISYIFTASHFLEKLFIKQGISPEQMRFSAYGLDTSWARGFETKTQSPYLRIGFIGQILPFKGPDILIRAFNKISPDLSVQLKIFGDLSKTPGYGNYLKRLAGTDGRICFLGTFPNEKMGEILTEIDVLVVPSTWYDFPLVVSSALATKTPVIATNLPGMNELVEHEKNGLLFERNDVDGLAYNLNQLINHPELLKKLRAGIEPVKTVDQMAIEYLDCYTDLLEQSAQKSHRPGKDLTE